MPRTQEKKSFNKKYSLTAISSYSYFDVFGITEAKFLRYLCKSNWTNQIPNCKLIKEIFARNILHEVNFAKQIDLKPID